MTHLKRQDWQIMMGLLALSFLSGLAFTTVQDHGTLLLIDRFSNILMAFAIVATLIPLLKASQHWGGKIGRGLQIIALGLLLFMFSIIPHVEWHVMGAPDPLGPRMVLSSAWWAGFFHILTIVSWVIIIYGFYLFWDLGRPHSDETTMEAS